MNLCRQIIGVPMGTNYASLIADLFSFCYEGDFIASLPDGTIHETLTSHPDN